MNPAAEGSAAAYDAIIVGAGPAGSVCAAHLAQAGRRVLLIEKARFPRDKVCGDCLNPSVWKVLDRLNLRERLLALPHVVVREVSYHGHRGAPLRFPVPHSGEIVVKRRDFDALLARRAVEAGVEFRDGVTVTRIANGWKVETDGGFFHGRVLIAADGRNSTVARLAGRLPASARERSAIQCHCRRPAWHGDAVRMLFYPGGYGGTARVSADEINLCLVARPRDLARVRAHAERDFGLNGESEWRTIAPIARSDARDIARDGLFLLGDAARVVEPFTGEGIYYAMRSGELAAEAILSNADAEAAYRRAHSEMYRGRLWINRLAHAAGTHSRLASLALRAFRAWPAPLAALTAKVVART
ncbi:MAG: geranylgeranyl reductase family protein [Terrimicrobiaceae bacterium]|nr:geranylgeranyl reductase family protein [Terrimicrobiaceae bacterium]